MPEWIEVVLKILEKGNTAEGQKVNGKIEVIELNRKLKIMTSITVYSEPVNVY